ncbi:hypothetical protein P175DRAFT_0531986 [Aspergillus ochraceoroseus IBT 24754]|uniref:Uncharacterized protein n=1 Tax=Aspergillus ochraceoroseus IBT 24754 TaxID=1392256 RepID=A0A2T5LWI1_9EURO|nr:uncharacterized protein P175DRAFT_0531986 [Aspergillus ochraceoroseus IBT 24754]PTU20645.1 hypothetical protein P175DRAFT_0531986 [Aspergillus ochraceoroseus IBT 24754]
MPMLWGEVVSRIDRRLKASPSLTHALLFPVDPPPSHVSLNLRLRYQELPVYAGPLREFEVT